jgi:ABC-type nitrate/sulfonate/bicarbonate transport system substrate-binding protein
MHNPSGLAAYMPSRRQLMASGLAAGAASVFAPIVATAQGATAVKFLHPTPAHLVLWSITYLAEDMGFYRDEGLEVQRIGLNGGPVALTALIAGEGLVDYSAPGESLAAGARGQLVKILQSYTNSEAYTLVVTKRFAEQKRVSASSSLQERIAAVSAAKGGKFGITAVGSQTDLTTRMAMAQARLDPNSDAQILPMGTIMNVISALSQNAIDCGVLLAPFTEQAMFEFGVVPLLAVAKGDIPAAQRLQGQVMLARPRDVEQQPAVFAKIVKAELRARRMIIETPDAARDKLRATRFQAVKEEVWPQVWANQLPTFSSPFVKRESIQAWIETGSIAPNLDPKTFPYDKIIDMRFVEQGLKDLGWLPPA